MNTLARRLVRHRYLLAMLTARDIKVRYKQSLMGILWALFMPLVIVLSGMLVRTGFSSFSGTPLNFVDLASVSTKAVVWTFFIGSIRFATNSLVASSSLLTKIYFPRELLPLSCVLAQLFDLAVAAALLAILLALGGLGASIYLLWLPPLLSLLILLTAGIAMLLSCANLFFRDIKYITDVLLTFGILFTPVLYDAELFRERAFLLLLNPIGSLLEQINSVAVLHHPPDPFWTAYASAWALLTFFGAWSIFPRAETKFAENV